MGQPPRALGPGGTVEAMALEALHVYGKSNKTFEKNKLDVHNTFWKVVFNLILNTKLFAFI